MNNGEKLSYTQIWKKIRLPRFKKLVTNKVVKQRTIDYSLKYFAKNSK